MLRPPLLISLYKRARFYWLILPQQFDTVIDAIKQGQEVDLSGMPPPPSSLEGELFVLVKPNAGRLNSPQKTAHLKLDPNY